MMTLCPRQEAERVLTNLASASALGKGFPQRLEPGRDQYVTTYVLQLPGVSDKSLEIPLLVFPTNTHLPPRL